MRFLTIFFLHGSGPSLALTVREKKKFEFFQKLVEIFAIFGASPVSMTPVRHTMYSGVIDTGKNYYTGINDTATLYMRRNWLE